MERKAWLPTFTLTALIHRLGVPCGYVFEAAQQEALFEPSLPRVLLVLQGIP